MAARRGGSWIWVVGLCSTVAWCATKTSEPPQVVGITTAIATPPEAEATDEPNPFATDDDGSGYGADTDASLLQDTTLRGGETYAEYDTRRDELVTGMYSGEYGCTEDCDGHDAGREWAERRGISSEDECGGNSWSFNEGCRSYAREQQAAQGDEDEEG